MRVLVFSNKKDYTNMFKILCRSIDPKIIVDKIEPGQMYNMAVIGFDYLYIIDDKLYDSFDKKCLTVLEKRQLKVIILLKDKENLSRYMSLNIIDYFISPMKLEAVKKSLIKANKKYNIIFNLNKDLNKFSKFLIKTNTEVWILDYKNILFFEKTNNIVKVHTKDGVFITQDALKDIEDMVPGYFYRTHISYIVNVNMIFKIEETAKKAYIIEINEYEHVVKMSRDKGKAWLA